jgi:hypothetical protein
MSKTTKIISREILGSSDKGDDTITVAVNYNKDARVRGYYLSVSRTTRKNEGNYFSESFMLFSGIPSRLLMATPRFNAAKLAALVPDPDVVAEMRTALLAKANR